MAGPIRTKLGNRFILIQGVFQSSLGQDQCQGQNAKCMRMEVP